MRSFPRRPAMRSGAGVPVRLSGPGVPRMSSASAGVTRSHELLMAREGSLRMTWKTVARRPNLLSTGSPRQEEPHMQLNRSTVGVIAALALVPSAAMAATIQGGPGNERLRGTRGPDRIDGNAGNDRIFGLAGDDVL